MRGEVLDPNRRDLGAVALHTQLPAHLQAVLAAGVEVDELPGEVRDMGHGVAIGGRDRGRSRLERGREARTGRP